MSAPMQPHPVLFSFRRCPYAIRARLALAAAGLRPGHNLELREVALNAKPPELLSASAKATVPVLLGDRAGDLVLDESLAIMHWALAHHDPQGWWQSWSNDQQHLMLSLIAQNDGAFKHHLDRTKYAGRYGRQGLAEQEEHRQAALALLRQWNERIEPEGWLLGRRPCLADIALLPFVRQFRLADPQGFDQTAGLEGVQQWLQRFLASTELAAVLDEPWGLRRRWRSPSWLYHLALTPEWQQARREGRYCRSSRGQALSEVGFIHLSQAHQLNATAQRFYNDLPTGAVTLLAIDPQQLQKHGLAIKHEAAPDTGELFPHLYGPLPLEAVAWSEPWRP